MVGNRGLWAARGLIGQCEKRHFGSSKPLMSGLLIENQQSWVARGCGFSQYSLEVWPLLGFVNPQKLELPSWKDGHQLGRESPWWRYVVLDDHALLWSGWNCSNHNSLKWGHFAVLTEQDTSLNRTLCTNYSFYRGIYLYLHTIAAL